MFLWQLPTISAKAPWTLLYIFLKLLKYQHKAWVWRLMIKFQLHQVSEFDESPNYSWVIVSEWFYLFRLPLRHSGHVALAFIYRSIGWARWEALAVALAQWTVVMRQWGGYAYGGRQLPAIVELRYVRWDIIIWPSGPVRWQEGRKLSDK